MLLTQDLIEQLHRFRIGIMKKSVAAIPHNDGKEYGAGYLRFAGNGMPTTQSYGLGHNGGWVDLDEVESFYKGLADNWELIVTPFEGDLLKQANGYGYVPDHFESVMVMKVPNLMVGAEPYIYVEEVKGDLSMWTQVSEAGWGNLTELPTQPSAFSKLMSEDPTVRRFLAWIGNEPVGAAGLMEFGGMFLMAGATTRIDHRGKGVQKALTCRRLEEAGRGSLIQVITVPGSESHRNAQRMGFQPIYSKLVMMRHRAS